MKPKPSNYTHKHICPAKQQDTTTEPIESIKKKLLNMAIDKETDPKQKLSENKPVHDGSAVIYVYKIDENIRKQQLRQLQHLNNRTEHCFLQTNYLFNK